jgi:signal transduction histidine kinase
MSASTVKVLVIDDSPDDLLLYKRALKGNADETYDVVAAENGDDGLTRIADRRPDCVLLDYSLPGRNGIEVLKRLRAEHPFIPVVMLTGQGNESVAVAAIQEGAQNYIAKATITPETIRRVIAAAVDYCAMQKRVHEQRASLEIFTRALAHDLKEPVRTIRSFVDILTPRETLSEQGRGYFEHIRSAADRMALLIDTVYLYTRLDASAPEAAREDCNAAAVLDDVHANISELIRERRATIVSKSLPQVIANRMQLLQVLQNLVCNAIHHCTQDPVILVEATEEPDHWTFQVSDNGPGVSEADRLRIFEPFKRVARTKDRGLGLGLAICKRVVESHGGRIWCEASVGGGAKFVFTIARPGNGDAATPEVLLQQPTTTSVASAANDQPVANVLLVDDSDADIELTRIMLLKEGNLRCNLLIAHDAQQAMAMIGNDPQVADLILLDINMPGMDGLEFLEHLRADESSRRLPIVMCSTSSYDQDMERAKALGAAAYVTKPTDLAKLRPAIEKIESLHLHQEDGGYALLRAH